MSAELLAAGLCCARLEPPSPRRATRIRAAVAAALSSSSPLPPLGLVADLVAMLEDPAPRLVGGEVSGLSLRRYEDRIVGPLLASRRRPALRDGVASLPPRWRPQAVAALAERLCAELEPDGEVWEPGLLRDWLSRTDAECWERALAGLADPGIREALQGRLSALSSRPSPDWSAADVHLVRHLPSLSTRAQRLAVRQILEASSALDRALPKNVRPRIRPGRLATRLLEEDRYPAGGYSSLTTSGSPENLVASELVYMEDDGDGIDLFDLRFTEGELLYYTRDESAHLRARRRIVIGLADDLVSARVKDPSAPWQRTVLLLGALHAVIERLVRWLGEAELRIAVLAVGPRLADEAGGLGLVLQEQIDGGVVEIRTVDDPSAVAERVAEAAEAAETDAVWVSAGSPPPALAVPPHLLEVGPRPLEGWIAAARALAVHLA